MTNWKQQKLKLLKAVMEKGNIPAIKVAIDEINTWTEAEKLVKWLENNTDPLNEKVLAAYDTHTFTNTKPKT
jgi:hypothetical protein